MKALRFFVPRPKSVVTVRNSTQCKKYVIVTGAVVVVICVSKLLFCPFQRFLLTDQTLEHYNEKPTSLTTEAETQPQSVTNETFVNTKTQDKHGRVVFERRRFPEDSACKRVSVRLYEQNTFNMTALVSYPGSGNTWLRHLIEMATGIFTGSVYFDEQLFAKGFLGEKNEYDDGATIVQKCHDEYNPKLGFSKAILLMREPFMAVVSFVQYMEGGHVGVASSNTFLRKEWPIYLLSQVYKWLSISRSWLESPSEVLIVHYEHVVEDKNKELQRICRFLSVSCPNIEKPCTQAHGEGSFHRNSILSKIRKPPYPHWVQTKVDAAIDWMNTFLVSIHQQTLPTNLYIRYNTTV